MRLVQDGLLSPLQAVARLSLAPAGILGIERGSLAVGAAADLTLIDPAASWRLDPLRMLSRGRNTPFGGTGFSGRSVRSWLGTA